MEIKRNLCVRTSTARPNSSSGFIRCKTIPPVRNFDDAAKIAYRMVTRLDNLVSVSIKLSPKGREERGTRYYFVKQHGRVVCRTGGEHGRSCRRG